MAALTYISRIPGSTFIMPDGRTIQFLPDGTFTTDRADEQAALAATIATGNPVIYQQEAQAEAIDPDLYPASVVDPATGH